MSGAAWLGAALALPVIAPRPHHQGGRLGLRLARTWGPHREPLGACRRGELGIVGHERPALIRLVGDQGEGCSQMQRVEALEAMTRRQDAGVGGQSGVYVDGGDDGEVLHRRRLNLGEPLHRQAAFTSYPAQGRAHLYEREHRGAARLGVVKLLKNRLGVFFLKPELGQRARIKEELHLRSLMIISENVGPSPSSGTGLKLLPEAPEARLYVSVRTLRGKEGDGFVSWVLVRRCLGGVGSWPFFDCMVRDSVGGDASKYSHDTPDPRRSPAWTRSGVSP